MSAAVAIAFGDDGLVVAGHAEVDGDRAGLLDQRPQHRPVGVADLARRERPRSTSSSPVESTATRARGTTVDLGDVEAREHAEVRGARPRCPR